MKDKIYLRATVRGSQEADYVERYGHFQGCEPENPTAVIGVTLKEAIYVLDKLEAKYREEGYSIIANQQTRRSFEKIIH